METRTGDIRPMRATTGNQPQPNILGSCFAAFPCWPCLVRYYSLVREIGQYQSVWMHITTSANDPTGPKDVGVTHMASHDRPGAIAIPRRSIHQWYWVNLLETGEKKKHYKCVTILCDANRVSWLVTWACMHICICPSDLSYTCTVCIDYKKLTILTTLT